MVFGIEAVLAALNEAEVRYLVAGGVAVVLHGHLRTTADLDLIVDLRAENTAKVVRALQALGFVPRAPVPLDQFADAASRLAWVRDKGMTVFSLWSDRLPGLEVDLFVEEPIDFDLAYRRALRVDLDNTTASVLSLEDLIALKRAAGRPIDLDDIAALGGKGVGGAGA